MSDKNETRGRPPRTLDSLADGWESDVESLYREGASDVTIRGALGISVDLWYRWMEEEPYFSKTIKNARDLCHEFWDRAAREAALGINKDANATMMIFNLKNRFPEYWKDRRETDHTSSDGSMSSPTRIELIAPMVGNEHSDN